MLIVDSSVWIDYLASRPNAHTDWLHGAIGRHAIGVGDLILAEVLQGFRKERE
jgi:hypothetical protein